MAARFRSIVDSEAFRLGALFAAVFVALTVALLSAVFWIVEDAQMRALASANQADIAAIEKGWRAEGPKEALEIAQQLLGSQQYIDVEETSAQQHAGNFHPPGHRTGRVSLRMPGLDCSIYGEGVSFGDGVYVFVGRDTRQIDATRSRIITAFAWISCGAFAIGAVAGFFFGRHYLRRIGDITRTCQAIMSGRFGERVPTRGSANELDRLSVTINDMLNRISTLLENIQQLSSDVAHDLRTPLARLRNRLEEVNPQSATAPQYAEVIARALEDTDQLLGLFAAILRVSQIESGSRLATFSPVSLTEVMDTVAELYRPVTEDHRQLLIVQLAPNVQVRGDKELLTQLFSNVVENAIHHTVEGTRIRVALTVDGEPGAPRVSATIEDDGAGIAPDDRDKVLRRFYRASNSRSTPGHGLGLALVSAIANLHQAKLELRDAAPGLRVIVTFASAESK